MPVEAIRVHAGTLHEARNAAAEMAAGEWLVFVDADDELDRRYVFAMARAAVGCDPMRTIFQPATQGVYEDGTEEPPNVIPAARTLYERNHLVIGTMVSKRLFLEAGGFWEEPAGEDWSLWLRCYALGATSVPVPEAIYRVGVREGSRNAPRPDLGPIYRDILRRHHEWARERKAFQSLEQT